MKTKQISHILACLLLLVLAGQTHARAQESSQAQQDSERQKSISRSFWDGKGASISSEALLRDPDFRAALGVSDEDYQGILESVRNASISISDDPEYQEAWREYGDAMEALTGQRGAFGQYIPSDADDEVLKKFRETVRRLESMQQEYLDGASQRHVAALEDALSPELKQQIREAWLAAMDETPMFSPGLFEALHLTDAQREGMERIKKELEPELEKYLEIYGNNAARILERVNAAFRQPEVQRTISEIGLNAFMRQLQEEPDHKRLLDESYAGSKAFATLFRTRMFEILTVDQRKRLQELIDNPPPHAQTLIQRLKRENWGQHMEGEGKSENVGMGRGVGTEIWVPGAGSWKPGDGVLGVNPNAEARPERTREGQRFPGSE